MNFSNAIIRDWKWNSTYILPYKPFHKNVSTMPSITVYTNESGIVKDEWNTDEIIDEHFLNNKKYDWGRCPGNREEFLHASIYRAEGKMSYSLPILII